MERIFDLVIRAQWKIRAVCQSYTRTKGEEFFPVNDFLPKWDQATSHFALYTLPLNKINAPYPIGIFSVFNQSIGKILAFFMLVKNPQD